MEWEILVDTVWAPAANVRTAAEFVVEAGRPGIAEVTTAPAAQTFSRMDGPVFDVDDHEDSHPLRR